MAEDLPQRKTHRLPKHCYDVTGAYFITCCTYQRQNLFGQIHHGVLRSSRNGQIVEQIWLQQPAHFPWLKLDIHVLMPNHWHAIFWIATETPASVLGERGRSMIPPRAQRLVRQFKSFAVRGINQARGTPGQPVWQRGYYDHIIRDEDGLNRLREYVLTNPLRWELDHENPACIAWDEVDLWLVERRAELCSAPTEE